MNHEGREDHEILMGSFVTFEAFVDFVVRTTICLVDE